MSERIKQLHALYVLRSGMELRYDFNKEYQWSQFITRGFTEKDLVDVIKHLKSDIKLGKRNPGALKFSNLVWDLQRFEEDLALAKALARRPKVDTNRESALNSTGRNLQPETKNTARSVADILKGEEALKALVALKHQL